MAFMTGSRAGWKGAAQELLASHRILVVTHWPEAPVLSAEDSVAVHRLDSDSMAEGERFASWAGSISQFDVAQIGPGPFEFAVRFFLIDPLIFSFQTLGAVEFRRDARLIRSDGANHFSMIMLAAGETELTTPAGTTHCTAGDVLLLDLSRPWTSRSTVQRSIAIQIPRGFIDDVVRPRDCHGRLPASAATKLMFDTATRLAESAETLSTAAAAPLARVMRDLLASVLLDMTPAGRQRSTSARERAIDYLKARRPGSVAIKQMCADLATTRSSLFRLFKEDGGVLAYDRRRRLLDLHRALVDPREQGAIAQLGHELGFSNKAHLSLMFREAFGYSASELRDYAQSTPPTSALRGSVQDHYRRATGSLD